MWRRFRYGRLTSPRLANFNTDSLGQVVVVEAEAVAAAEAAEVVAEEEVRSLSPLTQTLN
jgi:hypothetical protein